MSNFWLRLDGVQSGKLQVGFTGPTLVNDNGNLNVKDAANGAFTNVNAANVIVHNNSTGFSTILGVPDNQTGNTTLTLPPNVGLAGQYLRSDGTGNSVWSNLAAASFANGLSNIVIPVADGNITMAVGAQPNVVVVTSSGLNIGGNLTANNATLAGNIQGNNANFSGNLVANNANLGNLLVVTEAQLQDLNVANEAIVTGNLNVLGTLNTTSANSFSVVAPIIELGVGANGQPLVINDGMDRGVLLTYFESQQEQAFMGWKNIDNEFVFACKTSNNNNVITVVDYGNIRANLIYGNIVGNIVGNISGNLLNGFIANGTSTIGIPTLNGNAAISVGGISNVFVVAPTGIVVTGDADITDTLNILGTANLGDLANVRILGGNLGQTIITDGSGNLTWVDTSSSTSLNNGNSNITIVANGAVNISSGGNANVVAISDQAANITGNLRVSGITRLGVVGNVVITGGNAGQFMRTDGTGNLSWADPSAIALVNGNSNVRTLANGNITMSATGTPNVFVVTPEGTTTTGNATVSGNITSADTVTGANLSATGNLLVAVNANIVGALTVDQITANGLGVSANTVLANLSVSANAIFFGNIRSIGRANLGANGNITILGGSNNQVLRTDGAGNLSWVSVATPNALVNGNSNVTVSANSNITMSVGGFGNILTVATDGITIAGTSNLGNVANVRILGGTANFLLQTDGAGNLTWIAPPSASSLVNGNSNVVVSANGPVSTSVNGTANVLVVTSTGANLTGNAGVSGNVSAGNLNATANVTAGNATITANLTSANANVTTLLTAANANITTLLTAANANVTSNLTSANANITATLTAATANITGNLTAANANITGNLRATNANITGNLLVANITANGLVTLGNVANVRILGGTTGQALVTDGTGNLIWDDATPALVVQSNANAIANTANTLNFTGAGVTATASGNIVTVSIPGPQVQNSLELTALSNANGQSFSNAAITNLVSNTRSQVFVNGVLAKPSDYTITGNTLTFNRVLRTGDQIIAAPINVTVVAPPPTIANGNGSIAINSAGNVTVTTGDINLGPVANITITGGSNNQVLTTDGTGNVSWSNPAMPGDGNLVKKMTGNGFNGMLTLMEDGRLFLTRGQTSGGYFCYYETTGTSSYTDSFYGVEATHEIYKPITETGKIIDAGVYASSAYMLIDNGNLYTWGYNAEGQLGLGDTNNRSQPNLATTNVVEVYTHGTNSQRTRSNNRLIIKKTDGKIYGCGYNAFGQLGVGTSVNQYNSFVEITGAGTNPMSVWNMGNYLGCLVVQKSDGSVVVAGYNGFGQLGNNTTTNILSLTAVPAWQNSDNTLVLQNVAGGFGYVDGSDQNFCNLFMWFKGTTIDLLKGAGANNWGSLATGNTTDSRVPVTITVPGTGRFQEFGAIGSAPASVFVLRVTGNLYGWGYNAQGTLGLGDTTNRTSATLITTNVTEMPLLQVPHTTTYEYWSTMYIKKTDGYYYACGRTYEGQAGTGTYLVDNSSTFSRMLLPPGTNIKFWGRNIQNNTRYNVFMVDENNRWWACGWTAGYAITNQQWATNNQVPSPFRVNPYNIMFG